MDAPVLSVVIPIFNEASQISATVRKIHQVLLSAAIQHAFVLIDDGSSDGTWQVIQSLVTEIPGVQACRFSRNFGKEAAICAALEIVNTPVCVLLDADLQHPPELIPEMFAKWKSGFQIVEAVKFSRGRESVVSRLCARLFYWVIRKLSGLNLDGASDFKLMDASVIKAWKEMPERNVFFRGMAAWVGFRKCQIAFDVQARSGGVSKWSRIKLAILALTAITYFSSVPLHFVTISGVIVFVSALLLGVQTLYMYFSGAALTGFTTVILLQLLIGSIIMISLGIVGIYLSRIFSEVKFRPRYLVIERIGTVIGERP